MILPNEKLSELLLKEKIVTKNELEELLEFTNTTKIKLQEAVINKNILTDEKLGKIIAEYLGVPLIVLSQQTISEEVGRIIPEKVARRHHTFAFEKDKESIKIATSDPSNTEFLEFIAKKTGLKTIIYYATEKDIENTIKLYKKLLQNIIDDLLDDDIQDEAPIIKILEELIRTAYEDKASDIHIEPEEDLSLIRFRIDGVLQDVVNFPRKLHDRVITRIKVLSNLRTDEHLSAQDGKMQLQLEQEDLDIRVSIIPIAEGEKVVMRLLSSKSRDITLPDLGVNDSDLKKITNAFSKSYGMILSTGPTGSGKTTSIYAILKILNIRGKNITTIEDPVEYKIKGANQIQVNVKTNLTFANGLRSILRQDPNIIFVGEIRDSETAGIAVNAALTGHLVLSTLHTNDAATAIPRLIDMKVEPFLVASTVNVIIAQRLVRKICESCKEKVAFKYDDIVKHASKDLVNKYLGKKPDVEVYQGKGCRICRQTGYSGRLGLFEVLEVTKNIRKLVSTKVDADIIETAAKEEGMRTMLEDGLEKVAKGLTTIEEILRVTKVESS